VNGFWKNPIVAFFTSLKLSAVLLTLVAFASAKGTFLENDFGRDGAYDLVYDTWWFTGLLAMVTISLTLLFFKRMPFKLKQSGFALVHLAIVVILISAGITRYFGYEGVMSIREGQSVDYMFTDKSHIQAGMGQDLRVGNVVGAGSVTLGLRRRARVGAGTGTQDHRYQSPRDLPLES
jgi:cytochrome c biogenesis protein ResB